MLRSTSTFYVLTFKRNNCIFVHVNQILTLGNKLKNVDFVFYSLSWVKYCLKIILYKRLNNGLFCSMLVYVACSLKQCYFDYVLYI